MSAAGTTPSGTICSASVASPASRPSSAAASRACVVCSGLGPAPSSSRACSVPGRACHLHSRHGRAGSHTLSRGWQLSRIGRPADAPEPNHVISCPRGLHPVPASTHASSAIASGADALGRAGGRLHTTQVSQAHDERSRGGDGAAVLEFGTPVSQVFSSHVQAQLTLDATEPRCLPEKDEMDNLAAVAHALLD